MRLWRIASAMYPVWSGEGARLKGGRWNLPGTPAIYAATSYASAMLEVLVHANVGHVPRGFRFVAADIPTGARIDSAVAGARANSAVADARTDSVTVGTDSVTARAIASAEAILGWDAIPPQSSRGFGDAWLRRCEALVLLVPSVVTQGLDLNAVINPLHPDFARIVVAAELPVAWDARLLPTRDPQGGAQGDLRRNPQGEPRRDPQNDPRREPQRDRRQGGPVGPGPPAAS